MDSHRHEAEDVITSGDDTSFGGLKTLAAHSYLLHHTWCKYLLASNIGICDDIKQARLYYSTQATNNEHLTKHRFVSPPIDNLITSNNSHLSNFDKDPTEKSDRDGYFENCSHPRCLLTPNIHDDNNDKHFDLNNHLFYGNRDNELVKDQSSNRHNGWPKRNITSCNYLKIPNVVLWVSLILLQYGSHCVGSSDIDGNYNTDLTVNNYPNQPQPVSFVNNPVSWVRSVTRQLNDNPTDLISTSFSRFTHDQASDNNPSNEQTGWASMLTNSFTRQVGADTLDQHIKEILVPRVSGTKGIIQVREYIVGALKKNDYQVELDEFTASTPVGYVKFANIIASSNPRACRQLVLACHYDSKMMDGFLGATDSAVPCAMLLKISETFNKSFRPSSDNEGTNSSDPKDTLGLRFIFFDGEEAFVQWTSTDSLYGSRHLAAKWARQPAPAQCPATGSSRAKNELARIELFVLLDLIGASDTSFVMYNTRLRHHYEALQKYERAYLADGGLSLDQIRSETAFKSRVVPLDFVEDDHVPFKKRGVPILSLLAHPFPKVWHTIDDNYNAIDFERTRRILHVLEEFVAKYPQHQA